MGRLKTKHKTARRGMHFRKVNSWVEVGRYPEGHAQASQRNKGPRADQKFVACVKIGYGVANKRGSGNTALASCASGKNPRKAIAAALRKAANKTSSRSGAFAGLRRS